jgi:hypothetical protein
VQVIVGVTADGWGPAALMREQLSGQHVGPILQELEAGRRSEWKYIVDSGPTHKSSMKVPCRK